MEMQDNIEGGTVRLNLPGDLPNGQDRNNENESSAERIETQEKRTRFSLSHDEGNKTCNNLCDIGQSSSLATIFNISSLAKASFISMISRTPTLMWSVLFEGSIGNTSDNLEAVSEAASNHSVASSLELETEDQNDNLSDMVSANVSGRGTPNISGNALSAWSQFR